MAFPEFVDLRIAAETSRLQMNKEKNDLLDKLSGLYEERTRGLNLNPIEALKIFQDAILETEGTMEAFELEGALNVFNLQTLKNNLKL